MFSLLAVFVFESFKKLLAKASKAKFLLNSLVFFHNRVVGSEISLSFH